jgi:hypothetical protein
MRIRIQLFTLMRIPILILHLIKVMGVGDLWPTEPLQGSIFSLKASVVGAKNGYVLSL